MGAARLVLNQHNSTCKSRINHPTAAGSRHVFRVLSLPLTLMLLVANLVNTK